MSVLTLLYIKIRMDFMIKFTCYDHAIFSWCSGIVQHLVAIVTITEKSHKNVKFV